MATPRKRSAAGVAAERLIAESVDLVDAAGRAYEDLQRVKAAAAERIAAAEQEYRTAYDAAVAGGWDVERLARVDLPAPDGRRSAARRRGPRAAGLAGSVAGGSDAASPAGAGAEAE